MLSHVNFPTFNVPYINYRWVYIHTETHLFLISPLDVSRCYWWCAIQYRWESECMVKSGHTVERMSWMFSLPKACSWLSGVHMSVYSQQVLGVDGVNFSVHVENQTQVRDTMSRRHHRVYQLYSRTSGKHVQVLGRRISARGEDGDKYGKTHTYTHV